MGGLRYLIKKIRKKVYVPIMVPSNLDSLLHGKMAFVSGGSGGLGQAVTEALVRSGCSVLISGTNEEKLQHICNSYENESVSYVVIDMTDVSSFNRCLNSVLKSIRIDILINCAGVNDGTGFINVTEDIYDKVMDVNVKGTYFLSQYIAKHMIENGIKGHILNFSSASSLRPASQPYAISKWAINGMTKGLASELLPYGIIVNGIAPGPTATPMVGKTDSHDIFHDTTPAGRYATPQEIANLVIFMVSDMGNMIIGDTFYISGGSGTISLSR